jgi:predicted nucleic acid-binding protein
MADLPPGAIPIDIENVRNRGNNNRRNIQAGGPFNFLRTLCIIIYYFVLSLNHDWIHPVMVQFQRQRVERQREILERQKRKLEKQERKKKQREEEFKKRVESELESRGL